jgi:hypothetical protein
LFIAGGTITWLTSRWTLQRELEQSYDKELRAERLNAYKQLWQLTEALPRYHWPKNPTRREIRELIEGATNGISALVACFSPRRPRTHTSR